MVSLLPCLSTSLVLIPELLPSAACCVNWGGLVPKHLVPPSVSSTCGGMVARLFLWRATETVWEPWRSSWPKWAGHICCAFDLPQRCCFLQAFRLCEKHTLGDMARHSIHSSGACGHSGLIVGTTRYNKQAKQKASRNTRTKSKQYQTTNNSQEYIAFLRFKENCEFLVIKS